MPNAMRSLVLFSLLGMASASASLAAAELIAVELPRLSFTVDVAGKSDQKRIFYTANGNSIAFMVYPCTDPQWVSIRTPTEAIRSYPNYPLHPGERVVEHIRSKAQRADGAWVVQCDDKVADSNPKDAANAHTSWHISRYVYCGDQIIIMQGSWFKNGDIDQDYRTFAHIVASITLK